VTEILLVEERGSAVVLTLNRPASLNALSQALAERLAEALRRIAERRDLRVVVITGAGDRAFSVGTDLKERRTLSAEAKWKQSAPLREAAGLLWNLPQPVIAAIHGWCLGGGFEVALNCDLRVADESAIFSWPEMQLGAYPGGSAAVVLPRLVGRSFAKEMFFTARRVEASEALAKGVVDRVVGRGRDLEAALELAETIAVNSSPLGAAAAKRMVNNATDMSVPEAYLLNEVLRAPLEGSKDYEEGLRAFFEKRRPIWRGE
jgi:enoyl-CoA hydratase/carnithine racemase